MDVGLKVMAVSENICLLYKDNIATTVIIDMKGCSCSKGCQTKFLTLTLLYPTPTHIHAISPKIIEPFRNSTQPFYCIFYNKVMTWVEKGLSSGVRGVPWF